MRAIPPGFARLHEVRERFADLPAETLKYWARHHCAPIGRTLRTTTAEVGRRERLYSLDDVAAAMKSRAKKR
jgi:hypothetical protein